MTHPWLIIAAVIGVGLIYVVFPVCLSAFLQHRKSRVLNCPIRDKKATVGVSASWAALTSAYGNPQLRVKSCLLWPDNKGCNQGCLRQLSD